MSVAQPTIGALFEAYMEYAGPRLKTHDRTHKTYKCYLSHLSSVDATSLTRDDVEAMRQTWLETLSPKSVNLLIGLLSTMYNRAIESGIIGEHNPCSGLRKLEVPGRERMLQNKELPKFFRALAALKNETMRDFFLLCLLTGEQKSKVLAMQWCDIDLERGIWLIPQRKRNPRLLYLLPEAFDVLNRRRAKADSPWVFPSVCSHQTCNGQCTLSRSGHVEGPDKSWAVLMKRTGIKDLRIDDLRKSRQNIEPVRIAMREHYHPRAPKPPEVKREETEQRAAKWQTEAEWKAAVSMAIANPIERPALPKRLELSPSGNSSAPTFGDLFEYYMQHHGIQRRTAKQMRGHYQRSLSCFADRPADQIKPSDVLQLRDYLSEHIGKPTANRALEIISAVYNRANKWQLIEIRNPAGPVDLFKLESRERFLSREENERLTEALDTHGSDTFKAYIQTLRFTGARSANVEAMRWDELDLEHNVWRIPRTKNGRSHFVPLMPETVAVIESQRGKHPEWVFPGRGLTGHIVNPYRSWGRICEAAGLADVRKHDLRRTLGSWMANTGASLHMIGKTLGHTSQSATEIYARIADEPKREAMQLAMRAMRGEIEKPAANMALDAQQLDMLADALAKRLQNAG